MAEVEQAVFLSNADCIPAGNWSRLYFGAEFCSWCFPTTVQLLQFIQVARRTGLPITIATPVLNETFLPDFKKQIEAIIPHLRDHDELLASDLGTVRIVRQISSRVTLIAGRVLSGQKRGPRILDLELKKTELDYFRQGRWYQSAAGDFLTEHGIARVELDNLLQGVAPLPEFFTGSLHLPYAMVTSSRNCPVRPAGEYGPCAGGCGDMFSLKTPQSSVALFQAGNTQFLYNPELPKDLPQLRIDRVVTHFNLPR